jgi:hypothetical protein
MAEDTVEGISNSEYLLYRKSRDLVQGLIKHPGPSTATTKALLLPSSSTSNLTASSNMAPLLLRLMASSMARRLPSNSTTKLRRCRRIMDKLHSSSSSRISTTRAVRTATDSMPPGLLLTFMQVPDPLPLPKETKYLATARRRATASSTRRVQDVARRS